MINDVYGQGYHPFAESGQFQDSKFHRSLMSRIRAKDLPQLSINRSVWWLVMYSWKLISPRCAAEELHFLAMVFQPSIRWSESVERINV